MLQPGQSRDRLGADLAQQRGQVVLEALAQHQAILEREDHDERLLDGATSGRDAEEGADMLAVPGCLGDVAVAVGPGRRLARPALYPALKAGPPLPVMRAPAAVPPPC